MSIIKSVKCPLRIDLAGGTLDVPPVPSEFGPVSILACAIDKYVEGLLYEDELGRFTLKYSLPNDIHTGSGLGTSGAMNACWVALTTDSTSRHQIAERAYGIEKATGVVGGVQDQYMACYGGVRRLTLNNTLVMVESIYDYMDDSERLLEHMVLVDPGLIRTASKLNTSFSVRYSEGTLHGTISILKNLVEELYSRLRSLFTGMTTTDELIGIGELLDEERRIRRELMPGDSYKLDAIVRTCKNKCRVFAKYLGAGSGCMLMFLPYPSDYSILESTLPEIGCRIIPFKFDYDGIVIN